MCHAALQKDIFVYDLFSAGHQASEKLNRKNCPDMLTERKLGSLESITEIPKILRGEKIEGSAVLFPTT